MLRDNNISANSTAGVGSVFVAIADSALKVGGRIALVLPKTLLSEIAWKKTRELFKEKYVIESMIVSHDPERGNFSDNTDLSELLLVARKVSNNNNNYNAATSKEHHVKCVNLWSIPQTVYSSLAVSRQVSKNEAPDIETGIGAYQIHLGDRILGELSSVKWSDLYDKLWISVLSFAQYELTKLTWNIIKHSEFAHIYDNHKTQIPLTALRNLGLEWQNAEFLQQSYPKMFYPMFGGLFHLQIQILCTKKY